MLDLRLDNGLRVLAAADHSIPMTAVNIWYRVGSRDELPGRSGLAHLFEHLMFQGSANVASNEHMRLVQSAGGSLNATTWFDRTNYFETVPAGALELALWLEADRMATLPQALNQANLDNQRDVVKNERRQRYDNVPYGTAMERLIGMTFPSDHHYGHAPIGSMEDLSATTVEDAIAFFNHHYAPNRAVLSIVGAVDEAEAVALATKYFGAIEGGPEPLATDWKALQPLENSVVEAVSEDVPGQAIYAMWRQPADGTSEGDAAMLVMDLLGGGPASRLHDRLVRRDEIATTVSLGGLELTGGVSSAMLVARVRDESSIEAVAAAIDEELKLLIEAGPTDEEMTRLAASGERNGIQSVEPIAGRADELSRFATLFGDPELAFGIADRLQAVTPEQIQAVTRDWLQPAARAQLNYAPAGAAK